MAPFYQSGFQAFWRRNCYFFLAFFWLSGVLAGILVCRYHYDAFYPLMRSILYSSVSIVDLLAVITLPFLVSALAVYISKPLLLLAAAFGRAFLSSVVTFAVIQYYSGAGWLLKIFLCFSSCCSSLLLYLFWLRHISGIRKFSVWEMFLFLSAALLIISFDVTVISPFFAKLLS